MRGSFPTTRYRAVLHEAKTCGPLHSPVIERQCSPAREKICRHHLADIVTAAVYADARHIADNIVLLKSRALGAAIAAADASAI